MNIFDIERERRNATTIDQQVAATKEIERQAKMTGVDFEGVKCSAHKEDQWGLATVVPIVRAGQSVPFHFKNGSLLILKPENIDQFEQTWTTFRLSFFS